MKITNHRVAPPVVGEEWREFTRPPLYLLLALGLLLIGLAYQVRGGANLSVDVGKLEDAPYVVHFQRPETNATFDYRWSGDRSWLEAPGIGRNQPLLLTLRLAGYRPEGYAPAVVTITVGGQPLSVFTASAAASVYTAAIPATLNNQDTLQVFLDITFFSTKDDPRKLGVVLDWARLASDPSAANSGLVRPPTDVTISLLISLLLLYLTLRHLRVGWQIAGALGAALMLCAATLLAFDRFDLTLFARPLLVVMLCVYGMALLLPPIVVWTLTALRARPTATALQALMLIFLAAFAIKAGGMMHPDFVILDQAMRAHQVQALVADPGGFWQTYLTINANQGGGEQGGRFAILGQWNLQIPFPYPPLAYYPLAPFAWLWPSQLDTDKLVIAGDTALAALSATVAFALYAIAQRGLGSGRAGIIAAAISLFAPVSYLHFSDGDWTFIWGGWLSVVYLMALICLADRASKALPFVTLSLLAAFTLTSHTAIAIFATPFVPIAVLILALMRWRGGSFGFPLWPLAASFVVGAALSLVYYGAYIVPVLTVSIPAIIAHLGSGLGQDVQHLGGPLLRGFWPQIWAHFTAWPLALALVGLALILLRPQRHEAAQTGDGIRRVCVTLLSSWALVFALFSIADVKMNLLQRHMIFALPLLGLLSGLALVRLMHWGTRLTQRGLVAPGAVTGSAYRSVLLEVLKREWFGWAVTVALIGFMALVGWEQWLDRVLHYVLPPGTG